GTPEEVSRAFDMFVNESMVRGLLGEDEGEFTISDQVELGDQALLYILPAHGGEAFAGVLLIQDGNLGHLISAHGETEAIQETLLAFGEFMVNAEPGDENVLGNYADSTGGTWDVMPTADDRDV